MTGWVLMLALGSTPATDAAEAEDPPGDAAAYCDLVRAEAAAQAAPLLWPQLQLSIGAMNGYDTDSAGSLQLRQRLMAGVAYSASGAWRGWVLRQTAQADCARYRAAQQLRLFVERTREDRPHAALAARGAVLRAALPRAEARVQQQADAVAQGQATLADLHAAQARLDHFQQALTQTEQDLATAQPWRLGDRLDALLQARAAADAQVQARQAQLRQLQGWDIGMRAGYDRPEGGPPRQPFYGSITLSASLGLLAQGGDNARAAEARVAWQEQQTGGLAQRAQHARTVLQAQGEAHRQRVAALTKRLAALEAQERIAAGGPSDCGRALLDTLWFARTEAEAELAYARAHLLEIEAVLR